MLLPSNVSIIDVCYTHLSYTERVIIQTLKDEGKSLRQIAKCLNRSHSTISGELRRNQSPKNNVASKHRHPGADPKPGVPAPPGADAYKGKIKDAVRIDGRPPETDLRYPGHRETDTAVSGKSSVVPVICTERSSGSVRLRIAGINLPEP